MHKGRRCSRWAGVIAALAAGPAAAAAVGDQGVLADALSAAAARQPDAGFAVVIVDTTGPVFSHYAGLADRARGTPVGPATCFRAGSVSKLVTSLLALRLAGQGRIRLDAPVASPVAARLVDNPWAATHPLRIAHLLEHSAGLPGSSFRDYATNVPDAAPGQFLTRTAPIGLRWPPGTFHSYANAGHTLAAVLLEEAGGASFDALIAREVAAPLAIPALGFGTGESALAGCSRSYRADGTAVPAWQMDIRPSGALVATADELARVATMLAARGRLPDGTRFLPESLLARMESGTTTLAARAGVTAGSYGLGNFAFDLEGRIFRGHWGKTDGFVATLGYRPAHGDGFVLLLNTADAALAAALRAIIARHLPPDRPPTTAPGARRCATPLPGIYVNHTHDMVARAWLFAGLDQQRLERRRDALEVSAVGLAGDGATRRFTCDNGGWRADDLGIATGAAVEFAGGRFWVDGEAYRRVPWAVAGLHRLAPVGGALGGAAAVLRALLINASGRRRRQRSRAARRLDALLLAAGMGVLLTLGVMLVFGLLGDVTVLGRPSLAALVGLTGSLLAAGGTLAAATATVTGWRDLHPPARGPVIAILAGLVPLVALWVAAGWLPLVTWRA